MALCQIDDPQMPGLIPLIKKMTPDRPVLYRSHIQIRSDLVAQKGSPQSEVWEYLWNDIKHADALISHPIPEFVPDNVPRDKVMYMPATTDWWVAELFTVQQTVMNSRRSRKTRDDDSRAN